MKAKARKERKQRAGVWRRGSERMTSEKSQQPVIKEEIPVLALNVRSFKPHGPLSL